MIYSPADCIGGFSLAASWVWGDDLEIVCFCEKDEFCRKVLKKHWTSVPIVEDVNDLERIVAYAENMQRNGGDHNGGIGNKPEPIPQPGNGSWESHVDLICGGPPCQPASTAGLRKGSTDPRWLWPQTLKIVEAVKPRWILFENPLGITSLAEPICKPQVESKTLRRGKTEDRYEAILTQQEALLLSSIIKDLKDLGYQFPEACDGTTILPVIPASSLGAPHRRDRVWIVANANGRMRDWGQHQQEREAEGRIAACGADCHAADSNNRYESSRRIGTESIQTPRGYREATELGSEDFDCWGEHWYEALTRIHAFHDGIPGRLVVSQQPKGWRVNALRAVGNAIVPRVAAQIMRAIKATDERKETK